MVAVLQSEERQADFVLPERVTLSVEAAASSEPLLVAASFHPTQIHALMPEWKALEKRCKRPVFFQSAAWVRHVIDLYGDNPDLGLLEAVVISVRAGGRLLAVWPLRRRRVLGASFLYDLSDPFSQYSELVISPEADPAAVIAALLEHVRALGDDGLILRKVRQDSPLAALDAHGAMARAADAAPFVDLTPYPTFDDFHKRIKPKTRKNIRNAKHRLERIGPLAHEQLTQKGQVAAALSESFNVRREWLDAQGLSSSAFSDPAFARLVDRLAADRGGDIEIVVMRLQAGERTAAIQWGFVLCGRYYAYIAARNPQFDAQSPGKIHLEYVIRCCHAAGIETVDMLAPAVPYKLTWATGSVPIADVVLPMTRRGRLMLGVWQQRLRPAAIALYRRLPLRIRQPIAKLANRTRAASYRPPTPR
ncbi:MAG: GNAT family N-acetyltransferase [Hyphomicrobiaceae bacterium]|nr:MAG: GNAT family N-acetyltransferase [Hyphomicrobiaceae bacterium]